MARSEKFQSPCPSFSSSSHELFPKWRYGSREQDQPAQVPAANPQLWGPGCRWLVKPEDSRSENAEIYLPEKAPRGPIDVGWYSALPNMPLFRNRPELLAPFRRGDAPALVATYWYYARALERFVRARLTGESGALIRPSSVADLIQETFARVFSETGRNGYDGLREFGPYLMTTARNLARDWARKQMREVPSSVEEMNDRLEEYFGPPNDPLERLEPALQGAVRTYLAGLSEDLLAVHQQRFVLGGSEAETRVALGISRQTLRTREKQLRAGLRKYLQRAGLG